MRGSRPVKKYIEGAPVFIKFHEGLAGESAIFVAFSVGAVNGFAQSRT